MILKKIRSYHLVILLAILIGLSTVLVASASPSTLMNWYNNDDGFFYFKVAQNIVAGKGVTFDGINPTNGFHPLWMLICIPIFLINNDLILPLRMVVIVFGILQLGSAVALFDVLKKKINHWFAFSLAISFMLSWYMYSNTFMGGLESALSFFLIIITWRHAIILREKTNPRKIDYWIAGILAGLTILARLDNIIFIGFLSVWLMFTRKKDASILLLDALTALVIVVSISIKFIGYRIHPHALFIFITILLVFITGILSFYLLGLFSITHKWLKGRSVYVRGLLAGVVAAGVSGLIILALGQIGLLERFSKTVLLVSVLLWIVYAATIRSWLAVKFLGNNLSPTLTICDQWILLKKWLQTASLYFFPIIILVGGYILWSQVNFGTPMPVSGQIKQWWGSLGATVYGSPISSLAEIRRYGLGEESPFALIYQFLNVITRFSHSHPYSSSYLAWGIIGSLYLIFILVKQISRIAAWWDRLGMIPLLLATLYRVAYFYISGYVHMRTWYWTVETISLFLLVIILIVVWIEWQQHRQHLMVSTGVLVGGISISIVLTFAVNLLNVYPPTSKRNDPGTYLLIPQMLESMTPPGAVIGTPGGGTVSYFINDRTIINLDGLMNSKAYFQALRNGNLKEQLKSANLQYVYVNEYTLLETSPYQKVFSGCVNQVGLVYKKSLFAYTCN